MIRLRGYVDRILFGTLATIMAVLVLAVLWQVFTRFVLRDPSSYTEELARYLMIWLGLLGAGYAAGQRLHLSIDLFRRSRKVEIAIEACTLCFAILALIIGGSRLVWTMLYLGQTSAALQIPLGFVYVAVPISGVLIAFYACAHILQVLDGSD